MIKVNSKVFIKGLDESFPCVADGPKYKYPANMMIVEGLYYRDKKYGIKRRIRDNKEIKPEFASCVWYNTRNELQSEFINIDLLTEL